MSKQTFNILLVDDRSENLVALEAVLTSPKYNLIKANSGEEVLKLVLAEDLSLILMDVQMPGLDGFETAKLIRQRKKTQNVPIIFITALSQDNEFVIKGYEIGATDYIIKPFNPDTLKLKIQGYLQIYQDRVANEKINNILESITDAFISLDNDWRLTYINKEAVQLFKFTNQAPLELIGKSLGDLIPETIMPKLYNQLSEANNSMKRVYFELELTGSAYLCCDVNIYPFCDGLSIYFRDITEIKRLKEEMARIDRLNIVGKLAAGMAHEVRNPMTAVRGLLQLLANKEESSKHSEYYTLMIGELDRANSIITNFLSLAKDKVVELKKQNLKDIVENLAPLIQAEAMVSEMYIHMELEDVLDGHLDEEEIRQLILNLVRNSLQAMVPGGNMSVRIFMDNKEIVLAVQDDGEGIAPEVLEKIGSPFFTTKNNGTGLGLATCYNIAERHNAKINIETSSAGTTFYVRFTA